MPSIRPGLGENHDALGGDGTAENSRGSQKGFQAQLAGSTDAVTASAPAGNTSACNCQERAKSHLHRGKPLLHRHTLRARPLQAGAQCVAEHGADEDQHHKSRLPPVLLGMQQRLSGTQGVPGQGGNQDGERRGGSQPVPGHHTHRDLCQTQRHAPHDRWPGRVVQNSLRVRLRQRPAIPGHILLVVHHRLQPHSRSHHHQPHRHGHRRVAPGARPAQQLGQRLPVGGGPRPCSWGEFVDDGDGQGGDQPAGEQVGGGGDVAGERGDEHGRAAAGDGHAHAEDGAADGDASAAVRVGSIIHRLRKHSWHHSGHQTLAHHRRAHGGDEEFEHCEVAEYKLVSQDGRIHNAGLTKCEPLE
mmetsp:Transcript_16826/g.42854  ORF Transcript_16826/g.42854 Transcript_16826/m.42854 type:complete len:358 (+) Transcript_16826:134-1207(+)